MHVPLPAASTDRIIGHPPCTERAGFLHLLPRAMEVNG